MRPRTVLKNIATFGSGCFWCAQPLFEDLRGVQAVTVGYAGGTGPHPTYEAVGTGQTGYIETYQVEFDPTVITYAQLLEVFFLTHDPTQVNRQGHDVGPQYASVIFWHDEGQRAAAELAKAKCNASKLSDRAVATAIRPFTAFVPAEAYHQHYYQQHPEQAYCQTIVDPKIAAFRKKFAAWRKPPAVSS